MSVEKQIAVGNYVVIKLKDEWSDGRVVEIINDSYDKDALKYNILVLKSFQLYRSVPESMIFHGCIETSRRLKATPIRTGIQGKIHMPLELKRVLLLDYQLSRSNGHQIPGNRYTANKILHGFQNFFLQNKIPAYPEELAEFLKGVSNGFDTYMQSIMYRSEQELLKHLEFEKCRVIEFAGPIHLLRLIYLLYLRIDCVPGSETETYTFDYLTYLTDFLYMNLDHFFEGYCK